MNYPWEGFKGNKWKGIFPEIQAKYRIKIPPIWYLLTHENVKWYSHYMAENSMVYPKTNRNRIIIWLSSSMSILSRLEHHFSELFMQLFIAAPFTITNRKEQSKCPWMNKWINKMQRMHILDYYSTLKRRFWHMLSHGWNLRTIC